MQSEGRKFRFGVTGRGGTLAEWCDFARKAEDLGYSTLVIGDHIGRFLAPIPALIAAAQVTTSLRFAVQTFVNDLRHPAVLATEAATADLMTDGRFELGMGAGSALRDREFIGLPVDSPAARVERVAESVRILKAFFTQETVTYTGRHYQVDGLACYPKTIQRPHIPLLIGANGPRMLRLAAREADIISILTEMSGGPPGHASGTMAEKVAIVRKAAGTRYDECELHTWYTYVQVDGKPSLSRPPENQPIIPGLVGSREQVVDNLVEERALHDVSYITVTGSAIDAFAPVVAQLNGA
jgi:probable F420-dependent oxidoreductase